MRVQGPEATGHGIAAHPDLPPLGGPKLSVPMSARRRAWDAKSQLQHPTENWYCFIPWISPLLGLTVDPLQPQVLREDAGRLETYFAREGWLDTQADFTVESAHTWHQVLFRRAGRAAPGKRVTYTVELGTRYQVGSAGISTVVPLEDALLTDLHALLPQAGETYTSTTVSTLRRTLIDRLGDSGFGLPSVSIEADAEDPDSVDLVVLIDPGTPSVFGPLDLQGDDRVRPAGLHWVGGKAVREGNPYTTKGLHRLERRFRRLPGYADLHATPEDSTTDVVPIKAVLTPSPTVQIDVPARILDRSSSINGTGGIDLTVRHLASGRLEVNAYAEAGWRYLTNQGLETETHGNSGPMGRAKLFGDVLLFPVSSLSLHGGSQFDTDLWTGFHYWQLQHSAALRFRRGDFDASLGYRAVQHTAFSWPGQQVPFDQRFGPNGGFAPEYTTQELAFTLTYDDRELVSDPVNQTLLLVDAVLYGWEPSTFARVHVDLDRYWALGPTLTLRTRIIGGHLAMDPDAPQLIGHRVFAGGTFDIRGWGDRRLQPLSNAVDVGPVVPGGTSKLGFQLEPRLHVHPHMRLAAFLDGGGVWDHEAIAPSEMRYTLGGGVYMPLVIGSIAVYLSSQLGPDLQQTGDGRIRPHIQFFFGEL